MVRKRKSVSTIASTLIAPKPVKPKEEVIDVDPWDGRGVKEFYGERDVHKAAVGAIWNPTWAAPEGYILKTVYAEKMMRDGKVYRLRDGYYTVLTEAPPPKLHIHEFPICCGIKIITNFGNSGAGGGNAYMTPKYADLSLKEYINTYKNSVGLLMVALNNRQVEAGYEKVLLDNNFEVTNSATYHPGHGHYITTYTYSCGKKKK